MHGWWWSTAAPPPALLTHQDRGSVSKQHRQVGNEMKCYEGKGLFREDVAHPHAATKCCCTMLLHNASASTMPANHTCIPTVHQSRLVAEITSPFHATFLRLLPHFTSPRREVEIPESRGRKDTSCLEFRACSSSILCKALQNHFCWWTQPSGLSILGLRKSSGVEMTSLFTSWLVVVSCSKSNPNHRHVRCHNSASSGENTLSGAER